jgi:hypothetical protein
VAVDNPSGHCRLMSSLQVESDATSQTSGESEGGRSEDCISQRTDRSDLERTAPGRRHLLDCRNPRCDLLAPSYQKTLLSADSEPDNPPNTTTQSVPPTN